MKGNNRIELTDEEVRWLRNAYERRMSFLKMSAHFGYHIDTIKRLLDRYDILPALQAKHMTARELDDVVTWVRPCMNCGCDKERPKWLYYCDPCRGKIDKELQGTDVDSLMY